MTNDLKWKGKRLLFTQASLFIFGPWSNITTLTLFCQVKVCLLSKIFLLLHTSKESQNGKVNTFYFLVFKIGIGTFISLLFVDWIFFSIEFLSKRKSWQNLSLLRLVKVTPKGQLISEWICEDKTSPKKRTKNCKDFCPVSEGRNPCNFLFVFW